MKRNKKTFSHTVLGKNSILFVNVIVKEPLLQRNIDPIGISYDGIKFKTTAEIGLYLDWKFPFIHRKRTTYGFLIPKKKGGQNG